MFDKYSLSRDAVSSVAFVLLLMLVLKAINVFYLIKEPTLALCITILAGILGVLVTVIAILYAFGESFSENKAIKIWRAKGLYNQIFERFIDSIKAIFYSVVLFLIIYVFGTDMLYQNILIQIAISSLLVLSFLRTYRCFFIFDNLQKIISAYEKEKK